MDLIYCDKNKVDIGVMKDFSFDLAFGSGENDFELETSSENDVCEEDYFVYIEGTEYGGIIDKIEVITESKTLKYKGRTWHGILNSKVIRPDEASHQAYYTVSGEANAVLRSLISHLELGSLFEGSAAASGITISNYQFPRYVYGYDGIVAMLATVNAKLHIEFKSGHVEISAMAMVDYSNDELDDDHIAFDIEKTFNPVNHLICLGQGDLAARTIKDLYCDANGNISTTQTFTGIDEVAEVYDYPNVESETELINAGTKKLKELNSSDKIDVDLDDTYEFDIGDMIYAEVVRPSLSVVRRVTKKIVKINKDQITINYNVGEV